MILGALADRVDRLDVRCRRCTRHGVLGLARLLSRHGPDLSLPELAALLVADCPSAMSTNRSDRCVVWFPQLEEFEADFASDPLRSEPIEGFHVEPRGGWRNIFQLWRENAEQVPFEVVKSTWSPQAGHYLVVERVEVRKWPYGSAYGHYHWKGQPAEREKVKAAGTYNWKLRPLGRPQVAAGYSGS